VPSTQPSARSCSHTFTNACVVLRGFVILSRVYGPLGKLGAPDSSARRIHRVGECGTPSTENLRGTMIRYIDKRRAAAGLVLFSVAILTISSAAHAAETASEVTPAQIINSFEGTYGVHPGQRRNHIKGTCATGEFVATPTAAALSRSRLFSGTTVPVVARFSVGGGNPNVPDATRNVRGMALEFRLSDGNRQHMTMINTPVFGAAFPSTFNDMILASKPDPSTGKPDPNTLRAFFASHPDALAQSSFLMKNGPPESYANSAYFSVHTFKFLDASGGVHLVRWRFVPHDGEKRLTAAEVTTAPKDFLEQRLIERVSKAPALWDMVVYVGEPGDPEDNGTIAWPETRKHFKAGTLTITRAITQSGAECEKINFDPLVMADGIAPTNDPVLLFRSPSYGISFAKRLSGK
jgi:catalase